jgi:hypothetical protein
MKFALLALVCWIPVVRAVDLVPKYVPVDSKDMTLKLEVVGSAPLPYQAIRLQMTLHNISSNTLGPIQSIDRCAGAWVKRPTENDFSGYRGSIRMFDSERPHNITNTQHINYQGPLRLKPGEESSASFVVAAEWLDRQGQLHPSGTGIAIFSKPGIYVIKGFYLIDGQKEKWIEAITEVEVKEPQGDDKKVWELLQKDEQLAGALMCPVDAPSDDVRPKLIQLLKDYPKSSYAPYARFALARHYFNGTGFQPPPLLPPNWPPTNWR